MEILFIAILLAAGFYIVGIYNNLHKLREPVRSAIATLNSSIQRKKELSKDLQQIAENIAAHETEVHGGVVAAMVYASEKIAESKNPSIILTNLAAQFPNLKSNVAFEAAQQASLVIENKIDEGTARQNELADIYHQEFEKFPVNLIANIFGFSRLTYRGDTQSITPETVQSTSYRSSKSAGVHPPQRNTLIVIGVIIVIAFGFYATSKSETTTPRLNNLFTSTSKPSSVRIPSCASGWSEKVNVGTGNTVEWLWSVVAQYSSNGSRFINIRPYEHVVSELLRFCSNKSQYKNKNMPLKWY
uniref:LemA family protein n=1 Tax=OCS116 cluster bacterium TaxID=2030921 RepID=A0A2A4YQ49_9PROT